MANHTFKVQVILPGNVVETFIHRQYIDVVDRSFDKFKTNLVQRYEILTKKSYKLFWIDAEGDKISIFNEEDLRTFIELNGSKLIVEIQDESGGEKKTTDEIVYGARNRFCARPYRRCDARQTVTDTLSGVLHVGVICDGCEGEIRGFRYKCLECQDYDLCFNCEAKKLHGEHMTIRIVKPLDRPFNRHFLKAMMRQRGGARDGCEKEQECRRRHGRHYTSVVENIMTDIAKNISATSHGKDSSKKNENANDIKSETTDPKQFLLNSDTFSKAGIVLSNIAQHFANVMDPFAVHEFIAPEDVTQSKEPKASKEKTSNTPQSTTDEAQKEGNEASNIQSTPIIPSETAAPLTSTTTSTSISSSSDDSTVSSAQISTTPVPDLVTLEDVIEQSKQRESSPVHGWAVVDANGQLEGDREQPQSTGAVPKTPSNIYSVDGAQVVPNYAILARELENPSHIAVQKPQAPECVVHHPNPRVNEAIITMTSMGFSNGGGWLTRLLENVDGDIARALEKLHPTN